MISKESFTLFFFFLIILASLISCQSDPKANNENSPSAATTTTGEGSWACSPFSTPAPLTGTYRHLRYDFSYPSATSQWSGEGSILAQGNPLAISANGSRVAVMLSLTGLSANPPEEQFYQELFVFSPENTKPLWSYKIDPIGQPLQFANGSNQLKMTSDGRGLALSDKNELKFFSCDNPEPAWTWNCLDNEDCSVLDKIIISNDGGRILINIWKLDKGGARIQQSVVLLNRENGAAISTMTITTENTIKTGISANGSRVVVMAVKENPDDPGQSGGGSEYSHAQIFLYENGTLKWNKWLMNECTSGCTVHENFYDIAISADGNFVAAIGLEGKVAKFDVNTGDSLWEYTVPLINTSTKIATNELREVKISDNGGTIAAMGKSSYTDTGEIIYFTPESGSQPAWRASDKLNMESIDYSPDRNPEPYGFVKTYEDSFYGPCENCKYTSQAHHLVGFNSFHLSGDGNVILAGGPSDSDTLNHNKGHIYAYAAGYPYPFHIFSENEPSGDSDFVWSALSHNGAWAVGFAVDPDTADGHISDRPELRLHIYEIPPGMIVDVTSNFTLKVDGMTGQILEVASDAETLKAFRYLVKPGRSATLTEKLRLTSLEENQFFDICLPWQSNKDRTYDWEEGFKAEILPLEWDTPTCLSSYALAATGVHVMVLRTELYDTPMLDQDYTEYIHIYIPDTSP